MTKTSFPQRDDQKELSGAAALIVKYTLRGRTDMAREFALSYAVIRDGQMTPAERSAAALAGRDYYRGGEAR